MTTNMNGKLCVVTGANSGIGKETTLGLAQAGAHVVMMCRSVERGAAAQQEIKQKSGNEQVDLLLVDFASQASIREVAAEFKQRYDRLDVLVNNAGALFFNYQESAEGIEKTFAVNHLGYFLLTNLLLDVIKASAPARIVNVASTMHYNGSLDFDNMQFTNNYSATKAYARSKLANVHFTYELARRLKGTGVTVNCLHPGFVASNFGKNNGILAKMMMFLSRPFAISAKRGAETPLYLAMSPEVEGVTGKYFDNKKAIDSAASTYDEGVSKKLWDLSAELVGLEEPIS